MIRPMKCQNCGSEIPNGIMTCPACGAEVRLVPDYESLDDLLAGRYNHREEETEEESGWFFPVKKAAKAAAILLCILAAAGVFLHFYLDSRKRTDYDYQLKEAQTCLDEGNYLDALTHVRLALKVRPEAEEARLTEAEILIRQKDYESALPVLKAVISLNPASLEAFEALIFIYDEEGNTAAIKKLLDGADEVVRSEFDDFISDPPVVIPSEGVYYKAVTVKGRAEKDAVIYYSLDGTDPVAGGRLLGETLSLGQGDYELRFAAVNENGIVSDLVLRSFTVLGADPSGLSISPASGDYDAGRQILVTAEGSDVRYAFDSLQGAEAIPADGVIDMPEGRHTLYVFIYRENEDLAVVASRTYYVS